MPQGRLGERIPFEGVLNCWNDDHDLPDLLLAISRSGKTGRLHFSNPEGDKTLDLQDGKIVFAESSSQDDGLGQYLLRTGKISLMDYTRVAKFVQPGKRLGELLVQENVLAAADLRPAVIGQVRSVVLGLFRRTETWYRFKQEEIVHKEPITLDLAVPELILEGVRYVESWRRISKGVGSLESVYQQASERKQEWVSSNLDDDVGELVAMLATPTSLADICTRATLPDFEACRYLWAFRSLGWIDLVDAAAQTPSADSVAFAAPNDTPTPPRMSPTPVSIPQELVKTRVGIEPPFEPPPPEQPSQATQPAPAAIPESLIETQVSMTPPSDIEKLRVEALRPPTPTPIPEHLNKTQLSVEPPTTIPPEPPQAIPDELIHTQMFVEPPAAEPPPPKSTGERMESILEGDDPPPPPPAAAPPSPPPKKQAPAVPQPPNQAVTQFFDGPSALGPEDTDLPADAPVPSNATPSGFEALATGGGPSSPSTPSPADMATQPSVQPPPSVNDGMASFNDLALPEPVPVKAPPKPLPTVEADVDVISAETAPPEEPLLPPPVGGPPIQREALVPPRRDADDSTPDKEGFKHVLGDDKQ